MDLSGLQSKQSECKRLTDRAFGRLTVATIDVEFAVADAISLKSLRKDGYKLLAREMASSCNAGIVQACSWTAHVSKMRHEAANMALSDIQTGDNLVTWYHDQLIKEPTMHDVDVDLRHLTDAVFEKTCGLKYLFHDLGLSEMARIDGLDCKRRCDTRLGVSQNISESYMYKPVASARRALLVCVFRYH